MNDYAMTHPTCGECKQCEMLEKEQANFTYQPFSAQVTEVPISSGDTTVQQSAGAVRQHSEDSEMLLRESASE